VVVVLVIVVVVVVTVVVVVVVVVEVVVVVVVVSGQASHIYGQSVTSFGINAQYFFSRGKMPHSAWSLSFL